VRVLALLDDWPLWVTRLAWTAATVGIAYGVGLLIRTVLDARLARVAARTGARWDDALAVVTSRVPFWAALAGAYASLRFWPLPPDDVERALRVISALAVLSVTFALAGLTARFVASYGPRATPGLPVSALMQNVVRAVIVLLGALVIAKSYGWEITPYLTALGVGGLAVALALQDPLSNFFAGVFLSVSGQVRIGDYIRLDSGVEGYVADFNWRATSIRTLAASIVIVPNARLAQATVTNFHEPSREIAVPVEIGVHYLSDLDRVEALATSVAEDVMATVPGAVAGFAPVVRYQSFGAASIGCSVILRAQEFTDQFLLRHEFLKRLHAALAREGVPLPFSPSDPRAMPPLAKHE
jgi:small-conductance mechanosensitive channel